MPLTRTRRKLLTCGFCHTAAHISPVRTPRLSAKRPWSLRDHLDERDIADLITAYREGATAASLTAAHGVSLNSVKRLPHTAGARRTSPTRRPRRQHRPNLASYRTLLLTV